MRTRRRRWTTALVLGGALVLSSAGHAHATPLSAQPTRSWSPWQACPDRPAENCAIVRATVRTEDGRTILGGSFTQLRSPDETQSVEARNLAALTDAGTPDPAFKPPAPNGTVYALAADGASVWIGGEFTRLDGTWSARVARLDAGTGVRRSFTSGVSGPVYALAVQSGQLYIGGRFSSVQGTAAGSLAALDAVTGQRAPRWSPTATLISGEARPNDSSHNNTPVRTIAVSPDASRVYVGGDFDRINDLDRPALAALDPVLGSLDGTFNPPAGLGKGYQGMHIAVDGSNGVALAAGGLVNRAWRLGPDGSLRWTVNSDGDFQAVALLKGTVVFGGHFTRVCRVSCYDGSPADDSSRMHIVSFPDRASGRPDPEADWAPALGPAGAPYFYGVWTLATQGADLYAAGVFKSVSSQGITVPQAKIVKFAGG